MQLKSITANDPGQNNLMAYHYEHSPAGNITAKNTEHGNYVYQYDELYRLTEAANPTIADEAYTYDAVGNRLTATGTAGTLSYNDNNELLGYADVSFEYDDNGNMTKKTVGDQVANYFYDITDRLIRVEDGDGSVVAEYYYDPFGRRLWKEVGRVRACYFYADEGLVGEYDSSGGEIRTYGYAPDSVWTKNPLFQKAGGNYYWYHNDHLGTAQKLIDTSGRAIWAATYSSFGNIQIGVAEIENNLRFPGQYYDSETGLYYNWNRYYDSVTGRYLQTDPYNEGVNLYAYVFGDPVNLVDPEGLCVFRGTIDSVLINLNLVSEEYKISSLEKGYLDTALGFWTFTKKASNLTLDAIAIFVPGSEVVTIPTHILTAGIEGFGEDGWRGTGEGILVTTVTEGVSFGMGRAGKIANKQGV